MANVQVIPRFRPLNRREKTETGGSQVVVDFDTDHKGLTVWTEGGKKPNVFTFDHVFSPDSSQADVFRVAAEPLVKEIFNGYNTTIFAYGQTGSGKTHTMMGEMNDPEMKGIVPRIVEAIFHGIEHADEDIDFTIKVSYVEIYNEKIRDLLDESKTNLKVRESPVGVWIEDVTEVYVGDTQHVYEIMQEGGESRAKSATNMNAESSRSHSVFIITLGQHNTTTGSKKGAKLTLVDLAGSEKVGKTGAEGATLKEAQHINKSLSALGNVINALTSTEGSAHIPYRDSKLTYLLSDSLGGNSKTCLIITGSPSLFNVEETLSTIRFGNRAKNIKNKPKVNQEKSVAEYQRLLNSAQAKISLQDSVIKSLETEVLQLRQAVAQLPPDICAKLQGLSPLVLEGVTRLRDSTTLPQLSISSLDLTTSQQQQPSSSSLHITSTREESKDVVPLNGSDDVKVERMEGNATNGEKAMVGGVEKEGASEEDTKKENDADAGEKQHDDEDEIGASAWADDDEDNDDDTAYGVVVDGPTRKSSVDGRPRQRSLSKLSRTSDRSGDEDGPGLADVIEFTAPPVESDDEPSEDVKKTTLDATTSSTNLNDPTDVAVADTKSSMHSYKAKRNVPPDYDRRQSALTLSKSTRDMILTNERLEMELEIANNELQELKRREESRAEELETKVEELSKSVESLTKERDEACAREQATETALAKVMENLATEQAKRDLVAREREEEVEEIRRAKSELETRLHTLRSELLALKQAREDADKEETERKRKEEDLDRERRKMSVTEKAVSPLLGPSPLPNDGVPSGAVDLHSLFASSHNVEVHNKGLLANPSPLLGATNVRPGDDLFGLNSSGGGGGGGGGSGTIAGDITRELEKAQENARKWENEVSAERARNRALMEQNSALMTGLQRKADQYMSVQSTLVAHKDVIGTLEEALAEARRKATEGDKEKENMIKALQEKLRVTETLAKKLWDSGKYWRTQGGRYRTAGTGNIVIGGGAGGHAHYSSAGPAGIPATVSGGGGGGGSGGGGGGGSVLGVSGSGPLSSSGGSESKHPPGIRIVHVDGASIETIGGGRRQLRDSTNVYYPSPGPSKSKTGGIGSVGNGSAASTPIDKEKTKGKENDKDKVGMESPPSSNWGILLPNSEGEIRIPVLHGTQGRPRANSNVQRDLSGMSMFF